MTDGQISQSGPLFPKISLLGAKCYDFDRRADFDYKTVVLYSAQDARVLDGNLYRACTWFFQAIA